MPFETYGAISLWHLEAPLRAGGFDVSLVEDVVFHVMYYGRDGGPTVRLQVQRELAENLPSNSASIATEDAGWLVGGRLSSLAPDALHRWQAGDPDLTLEITPAHLPVYQRDRSPKLANIHLVQIGEGSLTLDIDPPTGSPLTAITLEKGWEDTALTGKKVASTAKVVGTWTFTGTWPEGLQDLLVVFELSR